MRKKYRLPSKFLVRDSVSLKTTCSSELHDEWIYQQDEYDNAYGIPGPMLELAKDLNARDGGDPRFLGVSVLTSIDGSAGARARRNSSHAASGHAWGGGET